MEGNRRVKENGTRGKETKDRKNTIKRNKRERERERNYSLSYGKETTNENERKLPYHRQRNTRIWYETESRNKTIEETNEEKRKGRLTRRKWR